LRDMSTPTQIPCQILDKRVKDGWFKRSYLVTIKLLTSDEHADSPVTKVGKAVDEHSVSADTYYAIEVGQVYSITWYPTKRGTWLPYQTE